MIPMVAGALDGSDPMVFLRVFNLDSENNTELKFILRENHVMLGTLSLQNKSTNAVSNAK